MRDDFFPLVSWLLLWYFRILLITPVSCLKKCSESSAVSDPVPAGIRSRPWQHVAGTNRTCSPSVSGVVFHRNKGLLVSFWYSWLCLTKGELLESPLLVSLACSSKTSVDAQKAEALVLFSFHFLAWISRHSYRNTTQTLAFLLQSLFCLTSNKDLLLEIGVCSGGFGRTSLSMQQCKTHGTSAWIDADKYF